VCFPICLEPAVKTGARTTRNGRIGVLATSVTLRSERFARLVETHAADVQVTTQACPGLVDRIESGQLEGEPLEVLLRGLLEPLLRAQVDTVVLGCTHYAFVRAPLARLLGPEVTLVDSAPAIARRTVELLDANGLRTPGNRGGLRVCTTGDTAALASVLERLWPGATAIEAVRL